MAADGAWLGIDFGTSNTVALIGLPGREPRPLLFDGSPLLPSAVCTDPTGRLLVGRDALHTAATNPAALELYPKRCIDDGTVLLGELELPVTDLIRAVLSRVAEEAARVGDGVPEGVVLTYPAGWRASRQETLLTAASQVLTQVRLMPEPVAAASYFVDVAAGRVPVGGRAVVYDFGAGTFDVSVVRREPDGFTVLAAEGLTDSGGLDIDAAIVAYLGATLGVNQDEAWLRLRQPQTTADRRASRQLWDNVRSAKEMLARTTKTLVHVPLLELDAPLGREQLEELAGPVLDRTVAATRSALRVAGVTSDQVAAVFLTGGSSRLTAVPGVLHRALGIAPTILEQPELAVAEGAVRSVTGDVNGGRPPEPASWPSGPAPLSFDADAPARRSRVPLLVGLVVLLVLAATGVTALALSGSGKGRRGGTALQAAVTSPRASASVSPRPLTGAACLIGTWRVVSRQETVKINSVAQQFTGGAHEIDTYTAGTWSMDQSHADPVVAVIAGVRWEVTHRAVASGPYQLDAGTVRYVTTSVRGTWTLRRNGKYNNSGAERIGLDPEKFACNGDSLQQFGPDYAVDLVRVTPAPATS